MSETKPTLSNYLALTIGPVYRTLANARKTRELWAASFLLSQFMRSLLEKLVDQNIGEALSPDITNLKNPQKWHGAGIWNDNCFFKIHDEKVEYVKTELSGIIAEAKKEIIDLAVLGLDRKSVGLPENQLRMILAQHFHCHAVLIERSTDADEPVLKQLSGLSASAEMRDLFPPRHDDFVSKTMFRGVVVKSLYSRGFDFTVDDDEVFTPIRHYDLKRRLPSLLEIAIREFRGKPVFDKIVEKINEKIQEKKDDEENEDENQAIIELLKAEQDENGKFIFKKRHKYVAVVQSDGDGVGNLISSQLDVSEIQTISRKLMKFSTQAVEKIVAFNGLPVYAGGDDLLFIAPLQKNAEQNIFDLLEEIQTAFKSQNLPMGTSMSFGVSIFYYKYPLSEALENGRELLQKLAKKLTFHKKDNIERLEKNALAFRVMLHAGQSFAAVLRQEGKTWERWKKLTKAGAGQDIAFVSGVVHTLERLGWLLEQACNAGTMEAFFKHHFNEALNSPRWEFVEEVRFLAEAIHEEYAGLFPPDADGYTLELDVQMHFFTTQIQFETGFLENTKKNTAPNRLTEFRNNLLYSALRMIQFLNADDHE